MELASVGGADLIEINWNALGRCGARESDPSLPQVDPGPRTGKSAKVKETPRLAPRADQLRVASKAALTLFWGSS
jgi:hypothetical protein